MKTAIVLKNNGSIDTLELNYVNINSIDQHWINNIKTRIINKGVESTFDNINVYNEKDYLYLVFGYLDGEFGMENKHELPPPIDTTLLFGDALILCFSTANGDLLDFSIPRYEEFYSRQFGGFHDLGEDSELSDPEDMWRYESEEDPDYVPPSDESSEEFISDSLSEGDDY